MADDRHFENGFITLSFGSSDFNEIWCAAAFGSKNCHILKYQNFANSKWRTAALFVSDYMPAYRSGKCSDIIADVLLRYVDCYTRINQRSVGLPTRNS